jgi:hypothetical protein
MSIQVAVAGCMHGHDVFNRVRATLGADVLGGEVDGQIAYMDVPSAVRTIVPILAEHNVTLVDTLPATAKNDLFAAATAGALFSTINCKMRSRLQPKCAVTLSGDGDKISALMVDLVRSGLYNIEWMNGDKK